MKGEKVEKSFLTSVIGVLLLLTIFPYVSQATIPQKMDYQGYLTSAAGVPVNGTVQMVFSIYNVDIGGVALWSETQNVSVTHGVYNVNLGNVTPVNLPFDAHYYLGIKVASDPEMTPRIPLTSVGYAFRAQTVETIGSHQHSGADITSGTVSEPRIDPLIARDSEVTTVVNAHATRIDNPHSTTAAQVGAAPVVHSHIATDITSGTLDNSRFSAYSDLSSEGYLDNNAGADLLTQAQGDGRYVNEGQANSITSGMISAPLSLSGSVAGSGIVSGTNGDATSPGVYGSTSGAYGIGVQGYASATGAAYNSGGYFTAAGDFGRGVYGTTSGASGNGVRGEATATGAVTNCGGWFQAYGDTGRGVYGWGSGNSGRGVEGYASATGAVTNYGGLFSAAGNSGRGVYGAASATGAVTNYGGYFTAAGDSGLGVRGAASATGAVTNSGGYFTAAGNSGRGVYGEASATGSVTNYGGYFQSDGESGIGVFGHASNTNGVTNYGGYFQADGISGIAVAAVAPALGVYADGYSGGSFRASGPSGHGVSAYAYGINGRAVFGSASNPGANTNVGGDFRADGVNGVGAYGTSSGSYGRGVTGYATGTYGAGVEGIGFVAGTSYDFYAAGAGIDYGVASSIRWKRNIEDINDALNKVLKIRGVYFDWDLEHGGHHGMGFIAEEVGKVIPEIVAYEPDGVYATGVDYGAITPMLVQAIKEQQKQIEELRVQIDELKKRLDGREGFVAGLSARSN